MTKGVLRTDARHPEEREAHLEARVDVWLWRARFFKTRRIAQQFVEEGRVRLTRGGQEVRLDKPSRMLHLHDILVFALGQRLVAVQVVAFGERRGPADEAQRLYQAV